MSGDRHHYPPSSPITLVHDDKGSYLEEGNHRTHALNDIGYDKKVPVLVKDFRAQQHTAAAEHPLTVKEYEGTTGDPSHITRSEDGWLPTSAVAHLPGARGEVPGGHRNRQGEKWDSFKSDIAANGIREPIFITVDHGKQPVISEGNHRRDAAVELGHSHVPVEVRYYGHAEQQGTVQSRAGGRHSEQRVRDHLRDNQWCGQCSRDFPRGTWQQHTEEHHKTAAKPVYYHGTDREVEDELITPGHRRNDRFNSKPSTHVFFTDSHEEASGWGARHLYQVEPTGEYEQRGSAPGDTFRNYMSPHPLRIVRKVNQRTASGSDGDRFVTCSKGHEHWGAHGAAGLLVRHKAEDGYRYLLQKRSADVDHPGQWSIPSGATGKDETPEAGALREYREEMGPLPQGTKIHHVVKSTDCGDWAFHTVIADAPEQFLPRGRGETGHEVAGAAWHTPHEIKGLDLHPAFAKSWDTVRRSKGPVTAAVHDMTPERFGPLESRLLSKGGERVVNPGFEPDLDKIMERGRDWPGSIATTKRMRSRDCHANSARLHETQGHHIATGYALSGGLWRQHSWGIHSRTGRPIETTEPRDKYHGAVLTPEEAADFARANLPHRTAAASGDVADSEPNRAVHEEITRRVSAAHPELSGPVEDRTGTLRKMLGRASFFYPREEIGKTEAGPEAGHSTLDLAHHAARLMTDKRQGLEEARPRESWDREPKPSELDPDQRRHGHDFTWHYALALDGAGHSGAAGEVRHHYPSAVVDVAHARHAKGLSRDFPGSGLSADMPPDQSHLPPMIRSQREGLASEGNDYSRRMLDVASHPEPGLRLWRGERRDDAHDIASAPSVGMHWSAKPEGVITDRHHDEGQRPVVWQARLEHPEEQTIPRSHPMWHGVHESMPSEAEVRMRPGSQVHVEGAWVGEPGAAHVLHPNHPERNGPGWKWHPVGRHIPVANRSGEHSMIDYSEFGIHREAASDTTVCIVLDVPRGLIHNVNESVDYSPHITVCYLGKDLDEDSFAEVLRRAEDAARRQPGPLEGTLGGLDTFEPSNSSDGKVPVIVPANIPGIHVLRNRLEDLSASEHKSYIPHVTLAYCEPGEELPPPHHEVPISFTHLTVRRGNTEAHRFPFGG
jgi:8-oxo-dGTP pyrophosphatase MutT (NUDIX family)/2'-5' RNA ligase